MRILSLSEKRFILFLNTSFLTSTKNKMQRFHLKDEKNISRTDSVVKRKFSRFRGNVRLCEFYMLRNFKQITLCYIIAFVPASEGCEIVLKRVENYEMK